MVREIAIFQNGRLYYVQLKDFLRQRQLGLTGTKAELILRLLEFDPDIEETLQREEEQREQEREQREQKEREQREQEERAQREQDEE